MPILTPKKKDKIFYSDFSGDFSVLPGRDDLSRKLNENAVRESIKNIVLTNRLERPFQPNYGASVRDMLFESASPTTIAIARTRIKEAIENFEPRATVIDVEILADLATNAINISIVFQVINADAPSTLQVRVDRIR